MKRLIALLTALSLALAMAACTRNKEVDEGQTDSAPQTSSAATQNSAADEGSQAPSSQAQSGKILIAYFSYGENANLSDGVDASTSASIQYLDGKITGNTGLVASCIQKATQGDLFSIRTAKKYSSSYNTVINEGQAEKNSNEKPAISTHIDNLDDYDVVFVGFPNWWYGMPMVMYSFFDEYDFSGKTIIPFCTSGGSAFSDAIDEIKKAEPNATVLDGLHIGASSAANAQNEVSQWVDGLKLGS